MIGTLTPPPAPATVHPAVAPTVPGGSRRAVPAFSTPDLSAADVWLSGWAAEPPAARPPVPEAA